MISYLFTLTVIEYYKKKNNRSAFLQKINLILYINVLKLKKKITSSFSLGYTPRKNALRGLTTSTLLRPHREDSSKFLVLTFFLIFTIEQYNNINSFV